MLHDIFHYALYLKMELVLEAYLKKKYIFGLYIQ